MLRTKRRSASRSCRATEIAVDEFFERLDTALGRAVAEDTVIDEVLPEIKRQLYQESAMPPVLSPPPCLSAISNRAIPSYPIAWKKINLGV